MFYVYVIQSLKDYKFYTGYSEDLKSRLDAHNKGKVKSTQHRKPFKLLYYEACLDSRDALKREKYFKTTWGKRYIRNRLNHFLHKDI